MERDFKGVWIPKEIWLNKELNIMEKLFLVEIDSLDREQGCFASNSYFAQFFGLKNTRVSQIINSLIKKGFINARYERKGREIVKRVLTIKCKKVFNKVYEGIQNNVTGYSENCKENNTINNKTKESSSHHKLINHFTSQYLILTGNKMAWLSRYNKDIQSILKLDTEKEVYKRFDILMEKVKENHNDYWTLTPNKLLSEWNTLGQQKKQQLSADEELNKLYRNKQ